MDSGVNFYGDQLRLAAFLRVVESIPRQPSRFRRHTPRPTQCNNFIYQGTSNLEMDESPKKGSGSDLIENTAPPRCNLDSHDHTLLETKVAKEDCINPPKHTAVHDTEDPASPSSRAGLVTYAATNDLLQEQPGARRRRLPIDELALIRTTTMDGLPVQSDEAAQWTKVITDVDPIEDSQMRDSIHGIALKHNSAVTHSPSSKYAAVSRSTARGCWRMAARPFSDEPTRKTVNHKGYTRSLIEYRYPNDGFTTAELTVNPTNAKIKKRTAKRLRNKFNNTSPVPTVTQALALTSGHLPLPVDCNVQLPGVQTSSGLLERTHRSPDRKSNSAQDQMAVTANAPPTVLEPALSAVLASITAPDREESESEAEENQLDDDEDKYLSDSSNSSALVDDDWKGDVCSPFEAPEYGHRSGSTTLLFASRETDGFWEYYNDLD